MIQKRHASWNINITDFTQNFWLKILYVINHITVFACRMRQFDVISLLNLEKMLQCTAVDLCPVWLFCSRECSKPSYSCQKTGACHPPGRVSHWGSSAESGPSCWGEESCHYCLLSSQFVTPYAVNSVLLFKMCISF